PAAGDVTAALVRGGRGWAVVDRRRRRRQVLDFLDVLGGPEAGDPLPAAVHLLPVAGRPFASGRGRAPEAAHPGEIRRLVVPTPVAGEPHDPLALRFLVRGRFLNRVGRLLGHD